MDTLNLYDEINKSAEKAIRKTQELISSTKLLAETSKAAGSVLFHGGGAGLTLFDPLEKFVKGEATFRKASEEFIITTKKTQLAVSATAESMKAGANMWFDASSKLSQGIRYAADTAKSWTNVSVMMDDSIKALATRSGMMATTFTGLARTIQVATGSVGTALLVASVAYNQFVKKWIADSDALQASLRSTSALFKTSDMTQMARAMAQYTAQGGTRQQFLGLMDQGSVFGSRVNVSQAGQIGELARVISKTTGEELSKAFGKEMEHFFVRSAQGATAQQVQQEILQRRVVAGGPGAGMGIISPLERYRQWSQDTGRSFGAFGRGLGLESQAQSYFFSMVGDPWGRAKARGIEEANKALESTLPLATIRTIGGVIGGMGRELERYRIGSTQRSSDQNYREGRRLMETGGSYGMDWWRPAREEDRERGRRLILQSGVEALDSARRAYEERLPYDQAKLQAQEAEIQKRREIGAAAEMYEKGKGGMVKWADEARDLARRSKEAQHAPDSGSAVEEINKSLGELTKRSGHSIEELVKFSKAVDNYWIEIQALLKKGTVGDYQKQTETMQKATESLKKKVEESQKFIRGVSGVTQLPTPGTLTFQEIGQMPSGTIEEMVLELQKTLVGHPSRIRALKMKGVLKPEEKDELEKLQGQLEMARGQATGLSAETEVIIAEKREAAAKEIDAKKAAELIKEADILEQESRKFTQYHAATARFDQEQRLLALEERKSASRMADIQIPVAIDTLQTRGIITAEEAKGLRDKRESSKGGTLSAGQISIQMREAQAKHEAGMGEIERGFILPRRKIQAESMTLAMRSMIERGIMGEEEATSLLQPKAGENIEQTLHRIQLGAQVAQQQFQLGQQRLATHYEPRERALAGQSLGTQVMGMAQAGVMNEHDVIRIQGLIKAGDDLSIQHAQTIIQLTQKRVALEEQVLQIRQKEIGRTGARAQFGIEFERQRQLGVRGGPETAMVRGIAELGSPRVFDAAQSTMQQILSTREKMLQEEVAFTLRYTQARANIIRAHYDNMIALEKGKLYQGDLKYGPQIQYGREYAQMGDVQTAAQMGRYAGEDYWRGQYRGERALRENEVDLMFGLGGGAVPQVVQQQRAIRARREAKEDFKRAQVRQEEEDLASIGQHWAVEGEVERVVGKGNLGEFYQSEGGRALRLDQLRKNQAAYSRRGTNVAPLIQDLAREQQVFAGQKMALEMKGRKASVGREEEVTKKMEEDLAELPEGTAKDKASVELAEQYKRQSEAYMATGQVNKAKEFQEKQEKILAAVPPALKKDFGDTQKQSLTELKTHTGFLRSINEVLGGRNPEEGSGVERDAETEDIPGPNKEGKEATGEFSQAVDKFVKGIEQPIQIEVNGVPSGTTGGGPGKYN